MKRRIGSGNVRELRNVVERSIIMSDDGVLGVSSLPIEFHAMSLGKMDGFDGAGSLSDMEKKYIKKMLEFTGGNKAEAAKRLGIGIATLYRKISEYDL